MFGGKATIDEGVYGSRVIGIEQNTSPEGCWDRRQSYDVSSKSHQSAAVIVSQAAPVALSWQRGILGCPVSYSSLAWDEIHPFAASQDITLSLGRRDSSGRASFLYIRSLPSPLVQTQLFLNESNSVSIMSHPVKRLWNMSACTKRSMAVYRSSPDPQAGLFFWKPKWGAAMRVHFWGHICKKKMTFFLPIDVQKKKKKNKLLSVCILSGYEQRRSPSTTVSTGAWSFRGVCKNTRGRSSQAKTPVRWLFVAVFVFM